MRYNVNMVLAAAIWAALAQVSAPEVPPVTQVPVKTVYTQEHPAPPAGVVFGKGSAISQKTGKPMLLVYRTLGDFESDQLKAYLAQPEVQSVLSKHVVIIDIIAWAPGSPWLANPGAERLIGGMEVGTEDLPLMYLQYGSRILRDSRYGDGRNCVLPHDDEDRKQFRAFFTSVLKRISPGEMATLMDRLPKRH